MKLAVLSTDRDVFARREYVCTEPVTRLAAIIPVGIVVEDPVGMLGPAGLVDEPTDLVVFVQPEPAYPAKIPIFLPEDRVDMPFGVEWRDEIISMTGRAVRKLLGAGEIQQDAIEVDQFSQRCHACDPGYRSDN